MINVYSLTISIILYQIGPSYPWTVYWNNVHHIYSDEAQQYFLHLTTGQFLCLAETAKNFEAYNYEVRNEETESCLSSWQDILKGWLQTFTKTKSEIAVKAIWALYNRRSKRFKELKKSYNARGDIRVKETFFALLNESFDLPKKKNTCSWTTS